MRDLAAPEKDLAPRAHVLKEHPRVLILTAYRWATTTRMAFALSESGLGVDVLCPSGHPLERVGFVTNTYRYHKLNGIDSIRHAIGRSDPDLVIPIDDYTAAELHRLYASNNVREPVDVKVRDLIAKSIGNPQFYPMLHARAKMAELAQAAGVDSPTVRIIQSREQLISELANIGLPAVLKTDGSSGGRGVCIVQTQAQAEAAFQSLSHVSLLRAAKRVIIDSDDTLLHTALRRHRPRVSIQPYIFGRRTTAAVACWQGEILGHVCVEVLASHDEKGAATVVRVIAHEGISQAVDRITRLFQFSGLYGLDFIVDSNDTPYLIDLNPRATQTCHLTSSDGRQPIACLAAKLRGSSHLEPAEKPYDHPIVLFPHGFSLATASPYAPYADSDLPQSLAEFTRIGVEFQQNNNRWAVKGLKRIRALQQRS